VHLLIWISQSCVNKKKYKKYKKITENNVNQENTSSHTGVDGAEV
jgi:hypothetical protein